MKERVIEFIVKRRTVNFVVTTAVIVMMAFSIKNIKISGQLEGFFVKNNPYLASIHKVENFYPYKYIVQLQVTPEDCSLSETMKGLQKIDSLLIKEFPEAKIHSLLSTERFLKMQFHYDSSISSVMKGIKEIPLLQQLVSDEAKHLSMVLYLRNSDDFDLGKFNKIINLHFVGIARIIAISQSHIEAQIEKSIKEDLMNISLIIILFITFLILIIYRDIFALLLIAVNTIYPLVALFFFFSILNIEINMISVLAVPLVLILSISDSIHIMTGYNPVSSIKDKIPNIVETLKKNIVPCFYTSSTDSVAFFSFVFNDSVNIREFGIVTGVICMTEYAITLLTIPFLLSLLRRKRAETGTLDSITDKLMSWKKSGSIILVVMLVTSLFLIPKLKFNTDYDSFFPLHTELRENHHEISRNFQSIIGLDIIIEKKSDSSPEIGIGQLTINMVKKLSDFNEVKGINSFRDELDFRSRYLQDMPTFKLDNGDNVYRLKDQSRIHISVNKPADIQMIKTKFEDLVREFRGSYDFSYFSPALLFDFINISVAKSLLKSLLSSALVIFVMFWLLFKNLRVAIASMLANIVPIGALIIIFVIFKININIGTAITAVIIIGLIVDDTIHILYRKLSLQEEMNELNQGLFITWLVLAVGFLAFIQSNFQPTRIFGLLSSAVFIIGYLSDLLIINWFLDKIKKPE